MPIQPIRFSSPEDIYTLLARLRARNLIHYKDDSDVIEGDIEQLSRNLIIATNKETYLLPELLETTDAEMILAQLTFEKKATPGTVLKLFEEKSLLETENSTLLHNRPLAQALLKLTPRRDKLVNPKILHAADVQQEIAVPFMNKKYEITVAPTRLFEEIFSDNNLGIVALPLPKTPYSELVKSKEASLADDLLHYNKVVENNVVNIALFELQMASIRQMESYLLELSHTHPEICSNTAMVLAEKNKKLLTDLYVLKNSCDAFTKKYADKLIPRNDGGTFMHLLNQQITLKQTSQFKLDKIIKRRKKSAEYATRAALCMIAWPPGIPIYLAMLPVLGILRLRATSKLKSFEKEIDKLLHATTEAFLYMQVPKMYIEVIVPSLVMLDVLEANMVSFTSKKSPLQQSSLLASATAEDNSTELTPLIEVNHRLPY